MGTTIFLFGGRMFSGKSTVAYALQDILKPYSPHINSVIVASFADAVKKIAMEAFGWDGIKDKKGRRLLQVIGTEAGRAYNENIWAEKAYLNYLKNVKEKPNYLIFDDWRFPNEYEIWLDKPEVINIYKIRCFRKEQKYSNHASEISLPISPEYYDYVFNNNIPVSSVPSVVEDMLVKLWS